MLILELNDYIEWREGVRRRTGKLKTRTGDNKEGKKYCSYFYAEYVLEQSRPVYFKKDS